jgi:hypothetical protein
MQCLLRHSLGKREYNVKSDAFIKKHDLFISYSHNSSSYLAKFLYGQLVDHGLSVWWDCVSLGYSKNYMSEIQKAIKLSDNFLFLISKAALKSPFVRAEWTDAKRYRKNIVLGLCTNTSLRIPLELLSFPFIDLSTICVCNTAIQKLCKIVSERREVERLIRPQ